MVFVVDGGVIFCLDAKRGSYIPWAGSTAAEVEINKLWPVQGGVDKKGDAGPRERLGRPSRHALPGGRQRGP